MQLLFKVKSQSISRLDHEQPAASSINYLTAAFEFTDDWSGLIKTAVFRAGSGTPYEVQLDTEDNCTVPHEAIITGTMYVSVRGDSVTGDTVLITTMAYPVQIYPSGATSGIAPTAAEPVTNADTAYTFTGTDTVNKSEIVLLQTEVNELKAVLRAFKLITEV